MILFKTQIKKSKISGKGLFASEKIPKKSVVFILPLLKNTKAISGKDFNKIWAKKKPTKKDIYLRKEAVRYIQDIFIYSVKGDKKTLYINHSDNPNILYHCGIGFAKKDIKNGDEITVDYRYFDTDKSDNFINKETGQKMIKPSADYLLKQSTMELFNLLAK